MAHYRKIDTKIWNDAKFRELSDDGKLLFLFVLTHPYLTPLGAMRATTSGLAGELRWPLKRLTRAWEGVCPALVLYDEGSACVWVPNFLRYNQPESPNVVKAWAKALDAIPECALRTRAVRAAAEACERIGKGFGKAFQEGFGKGYLEDFPKGSCQGSPYQEQEQEQEQKQEPSTPLRSVEDTPQPPRGDERFTQFWAAYPNREAKQVALKAWKKLRVDDALLAAMLAAIAWQRETDRWQRGIIPHPSTWLNQRRWEDERPTTPQSPALRPDDEDDTCDAAGTPWPGIRFDAEAGVYHVHDLDPQTGLWVHKTRKAEHIPVEIRRQHEGADVRP